MWKGALGQLFKFLSLASPYFTSLLESGFAESSLLTSKEASSEITTSTTTEDDSESSWDGTEDDSDHETDVLVAKGSSKPAQKGTFHNVQSPSSFTTYRAVLVYLLSHHITFAPLLSTFRASTYPAAAEAASSRHQAIRVLLSKSPDLPAPASPKSVYRLAHLLQLPKLESLALNEIQRQLSVENAAYELYGSVAGVYDAIREIVLDFCVENWAAICETSAMKEMEQLAEAGELPPKVIATAMQLAKRLKT